MNFIATEKFYFVSSAFESRSWGIRKNSWKEAMREKDWSKKGKVRPKFKKFLESQDSFTRLSTRTRRKKEDF